MNAWRWITDRSRAGKGAVLAIHRRPGPRTDPPSSDPWRRELAEIYRLHADFVRRSADHLGVPPPHLDDVVHDVFIIAHRRLPDFDQARGSLRSWLFGITKRVVLHHRRDAARHRRRLRVVPEPPRVPCPDEEVARRQVIDRIEAFLESLPPKQRLVFALADVEGMAGVEVARSLGVNINTVYARLRAARRAFNLYLDQLEVDREDGDGHGAA